MVSLTVTGTASTSMGAITVRTADAFFSFLFRFDHIPYGKAGHSQQDEYQNQVFHTSFSLLLGLLFFVVCASAAFLSAAEQR